MNTTLSQAIVTCKHELKNQIYKKEITDPKFFLKEGLSEQPDLCKIEVVHKDIDNRHLQVALFSIEDVGNSDYFLSKGLKKMGFKVCAFRHRNNDHDYPHDVQVLPFGMMEPAEHNMDAKRIYQNQLQQNFDNIQTFLMQSEIVQVEDTWGIPPIKGQTLIDINQGDWLNVFKDDKMLIIYHKGTTYRHNHENIHKFIEEKFKCRVIHFVSTPDLLQCHDDAVWMPNIVDTEYILKRFPKININDDLIRIIHPYTNPDNFGTQAVFKAMEELKEEGYPLIFYAVQGLTWAKCLDLMRQCDIHIGKIIDNLSNPYGNTKIFLPYGLGCLEGGAYKIPSLTSFPEGDERHDREPKCTSKLPCINARPNDIKAKLQYLLDNMEEGKMMGEDMYKYVRRYHDIKPVCKRWDEIVRTEYA